MKPKIKKCRHCGTDEVTLKMTIFGLSKSENGFFVECINGHKSAKRKIGWRAIDRWNKENTVKRTSAASPA